ncbi:MAG: AgmX/PglI C-terminal domain-containing protein [Deltaproteobacteria bacterium]|nr:AgmX/PglI C-terminal domain-containing protein [Deltaproteobacteria bacterium]
MRNREDVRLALRQAVQAALPISACAAATGASRPDPFALPALANPFAPAARPGRVRADAPEGSYEYRPVQAAPALDAGEHESRARAIEIRIAWGRNVLRVCHLCPPRGFVLGETESREGRDSFPVPASKLGARSVPLVVQDEAGAAVIVPPGAAATLALGGRAPVSLDDAVRSGRAQPYPELPGAYRIALGKEARVRIGLGDLTFEVAETTAGKKHERLAAGLAAVLGATMLCILASLVGHLGLLGAVAAWVPSLDPAGGEQVTDEQRYLIQHYLDAAAEKEQAERPPPQLAEQPSSGPTGGQGVQAKGEAGAAGTTSSQTHGRFAIQGASDNRDPHLARAAALRDAAEFGILTLLASDAGGDPNALVAAWGRADSDGLDPLSARGHLWGREPGDAFGPGGLGLTGVGEGGGGLGEGIGAGPVGTIGHGSGTGFGQDFGNGAARLSAGRHRPKAPSVRIGPTGVSGRLPPEVIQRIVRANFGRFRMCYENGLRGSPSLQGRVSVGFVIGRDGQVSNVSGGGDLPDGGVVSCVCRSFYALTFPQPAGGIVTVTYPIIFTPGG